jgi:phosphopantetheinyl transferase (holo-ACP synthase)
MLTYKLIHSLNPEDSSDWEQLSLAELGENIHPNRMKGFCLAREALRHCLKQKGIHLKISELRLNKYSNVNNQNSLTISLSHTPTCGACVVANSDQILSVGIDIEPLTRLVKPMILERISHANDLSLPGINLWALKEACFKALMNTEKFNVPQEFSSLIISKDKWHHEKSSIQGEWSLQEIDGHILALAWIKI